MITIYCLVYNEELLIQFMISYYRSRFSNCKIIFFDNSSTDNTVEIAKNNGCEIRTYNSNNTLDDGLHMQIKNSCWKDAETDWVLVCDLDELLDITEQDLKNEEVLGTTIIRPETWHMINMEDNYDFINIKWGYRDTNDPSYDKDLLFNKKYVEEINYGAGCHNHNPGPPTGLVKYTDNIYKLYHYKYINEDLEVFKNKLTKERLSEANKQNNWGIQCLRTEEGIRIDFAGKRRRAIKLF